MSSQRPIKSSRTGMRLGSVVGRVLGLGSILLLMVLVPSPVSANQPQAPTNIAQSLMPAALSPDFSLSAYPTSLRVQVGSAQTVQITATSLNTFTGTVYLAGFAIPTFLSLGPGFPAVSLNPSSLSLTSGGSQNSVLTVAVPSNAAAGNYTVQVEASGGCSLIHPAEVALKVVGPDFSITPVKNPLTVSQSVSDFTDLNLASLDGFAGTVSVSTFSPEFAVTFSRQSVHLIAGGTNSTTITVAPNPTTGPGNYTLYVDASVGFSLSHLVIMNVTVSGATFSLSSDRDLLTVVAGASNSSTITVTPSGGYSGTVTLMANSFSSNITGSFATSSVMLPPARTSMLTVSVTSGTSPGYYSILVMGTDGSITSSVNVVVVVKPEYFDVSTDPGFMVLIAGSSCQSTITATGVNGFTGMVSLTEKHDAGLTVSMSATSVTIPVSPTSILTISADANARPGLYNVQVNGTIGSTVRQASVEVVVIGPDFDLSANPSPVTFSAGSTATSTITASPFLGFSDSVDLSVSASTDLNASIVPTTVASGSYSATLSLNSTIPGTYSVDITGSTASGLHHDVVIEVIVQAPDFTIEPSTATNTPCATGATCDTTITITGQNGFSGTVTFSVSADAGLNCNQPSAVIGGSGSATLMCSATTAGNYGVTVTGTSGTLSHSTGVITYQVNAEDFSLSAGTVSPSSILAGASGSVGITVTPVGGFAGPVSFAVSTSNPSGLVCQTPVEWTGSNTPILSCSATNAGDYSVTVTGSGMINGSPVQHATGSILFHVVDFSITANPTTRTMDTGVAGTSTITIAALNQFTGSLALSTDHSECSLSSTTVAGSGTSDLSCTFTSPGTVTVTITGMMGSLSHTATVTFTVNPAPDFKITATGPVSFNSGGTATSTITVTPVNPSQGGTYSVDLTATVSPSAGLSVSISPGVLVCTYSGCGTYGTSTATLSSSVPGSYTVTITGTSNIGTHTTTVQVTVASPDFGISVAPTTLTISTGGSSTSTITISSINGFSGSVALTTSVSPSGPTVTLGTSQADASHTSTVKITIGNDVAAGTYTVTVTGTSGSLEHSATVTVKVTAVQPVSTAPSTILGLDPNVFYSIIGVIAAIIVIGVALVFRTRSKPKK